MTLGRVSFRRQLSRGQADRYTRSAIITKALSVRSDPVAPALLESLGRKEQEFYKRLEVTLFSETVTLHIFRDIDKTAFFKDI